MKVIKALLFVALLLVGKTATAADFETTVSTNYTVPNLINLQLANSEMSTSWFTGQAGGRTVYSSDVTVGNIVHGTGIIEAHATWVITYTPNTRTVNLNAGRTHITNWWGDQRCNVYEDGTCNCHTNPNWTICNIPQMATYVTSLVALARAATLNAQFALQAAGYTVTRN
jgi:hypothetical protein